MKKICFVSYSAYGLFDPSAKPLFGGAEIQLYLLASHLVKDSSFCVSFITAGMPPYTIKKIKGINVYKVIPFDRGGYWGRKIIGACRLLFYLYRNQADVYVQRALGPETGLIAFFCWIRRKKFIYMIAHEWDVSGVFEKNMGIMGKIGIFGLKKATKRIAQNTHQQALCKKNYQRQSMLFPTVYPLSLSQVAFRDRTYALWVGRAETWKQPEIFLKAVARFPDYSFMMIMPPGNDGTFYERRKQEVKKYANCQFFADKPFEKMDNYFQSARLFVNTSSVEGFPNTFIQAAKNGTPVLSWVVNPDHVLTRYDFGIDAHASMPKFLDSLNQMMTDENQFKKRAHNGRKYVQRYHDLSFYGEEFKKILLT